MRGSFSPSLEGLAERDADRARAALSVAGGRSLPRPEPAPRGRVQRAPAPSMRWPPAPRGSSSRPRARSLPRLSDPDRLAAAGLTIAPGLEISPQDFGATAGARRLLPGGPGGRARRVLRPRRRRRFLSRLGDAARSASSSSATSSSPIRQFDGATQRSLAALDRVVISPQRELLPEAGDRRRGRSDRSATVIDYVRRAGRARARRSRSTTSTERGRSLERQWRGSRGGHGGARPRGRTATRPMAATGRISRHGSESRHRISQLAVDDRAAGRRACLDAVPSMEYHGRIGDWAAEIRSARERGETVVFVAASAGRAERTIELLADYEHSRAGGRRRRRPVERPPCSSRPDSCRAASTCRPPSCCLCRDRPLRGRAARSRAPPIGRPAPSSRTSAI